MNKLLQANNRKFIVEDFLGQGAYGKVYKAFSIERKKKCAIKSVDLESV